MSNIQKWAYSKAVGILPAAGDEYDRTMEAVNTRLYELGKISKLLSEEEYEDLYTALCMANIAPRKSDGRSDVDSQGDAAQESAEMFLKSIPENLSMEIGLNRVNRIATLIRCTDNRKPLSSYKDIPQKLSYVINDIQNLFYADMDKLMDIEKRHIRLICFGNTDDVAVSANVDLQAKKTMLSFYEWVAEQIRKDKLLYRFFFFAKYNLIAYLNIEQRISVLTDEVEKCSS